MAEYVGKSGVDAVFKALQRICIVIAKYEAKMLAAIAVAETAGVITSAQATVATGFVAAARSTCDVFRAVAGNSGF